MCTPENSAIQVIYYYYLLLLLLLLLIIIIIIIIIHAARLKTETKNKSVSDGRPRINTTDSDRLMQATKLGTLIQHNTNLMLVPNWHTRTLFVFDNAQSPGLSVCRDLL